MSPEQEIERNLPKGTPVAVTTVLCRDFLSLPVVSVRQEVKGNLPSWILTLILCHLSRHFRIAMHDLPLLPVLSGENFSEMWRRLKTPAMPPWLAYALIGPEN